MFRVFHFLLIKETVSLLLQNSIFFNKMLGLPSQMNPKLFLDNESLDNLGILRGANKNRIMCELEGKVPYINNIPKALLSMTNVIPIQWRKD